MARVHVVGSGASGVHFALTLLKKGYEVVMVDVGHARPKPVEPGSTFEQLKETLAEPTDYFLGKEFESVQFPSNNPDFYGFPPSKGYVFKHPAEVRYEFSSFSPLISFAQGGLAEAWTAGSYPYDDDDLTLFPFRFNDIAPCYDEVAERIGVNGDDDDLARFMPIHEHLLPPLKLDDHSEQLLARYSSRRNQLNRSLGFYMGRSRIAALSEDREDRKACAYLGRCFWGCPIDAFYTPLFTLRECQRYSGFSYVSGVYVSHFRFDGGCVRSLVMRLLGGGGIQEIDVDTLVLAAGTLGTAGVFLRSLYNETGERICLRGLMDNRQVYVPFLNPARLGRKYSADTYQYHMLAIALEAEDAKNRVHGQITTLKSTMMHPILQRLPFDLATSVAVGRATHGALGVVNVNFRDTRRDENTIGLIDTEGDGDPIVAVRYSPAKDEPQRLPQALRRIRKALQGIGCFALPGMTEMRPLGASVHYAGTLPMSHEANSYTTTEFGQIRGFDNLYTVDGSTFAFLPAKNSTFTLMANAVRIARSAF